MTGHSLPSAMTIAQKFPWAKYQTFADIGTAEGCLPVQVALAHPHMMGQGFDMRRSVLSSTSMSRLFGFRIGSGFASVISLRNRCQPRTCL
jgi:hypothetical protein